MQSMSFCLGADRSLDLSNSSFEMRCDASPIRHCNPYLKAKIKACANKCKDIRSNLGKLKDLAASERSAFECSLSKLQQLLTPKQTRATLAETGVQTLENDVSIIDAQVLDDNSSDQMSIIDRLGEFRGEVKGECLSESEMELENREELCAEISKLRNRVELPEVEFRSARRVERPVKAELPEPDCEMAHRKVPLENDDEEGEAIDKNYREIFREKDTQIKNVWILWLVLIVLMLAVILNFLI
eukprot:TRINITY_DN12848_c0_g3_i1.p1 TRINITY_DN12848_c0_g3~~TRINITY_DN12848_c0_g3_i1.p1  ORF type:complete len:243 (-),score=49.27 TRINITY_DN12848_c0_g3_i1:74-802(-)